MKVGTVYPITPQPTADHSDIAALQQRLAECSEALLNMAQDVGSARQIREFSSDQRKRCLAVAALPLLKAGASATAAELEARGGESFGAALKQLATQLTQAERIIAEHDALKIKWESARSLLASLREEIKRI